MDNTTATVLGSRACTCWQFHPTTACKLGKAHEPQPQGIMSADKKCHQKIIGGGAAARRVLAAAGCACCDDPARGISAGGAMSGFCGVLAG